MCYTHTPYHSACGCYGKPTITGEPCIRALTSPGYSKGCWDTIDTGVETVSGSCPKCMKRLLMPPPSFARSLSGDPLNSLSTISSSGSSSGASTPGPSPGMGMGMERDPFEGLRRVGSGMSVFKLGAQKAGDSLPSLAATTSPASPTGGTALTASFRTPDETENLHWRMYGGSAASASFKRDAA